MEGRMPGRLVAMAALAIVTSPSMLAGVQEPALDPLEGFVQSNLYLRPPPNHCDAPGLALTLAREAGIPAGVEHLPGNCNYRLPGQEDPGAWIPLIGLTYREALERLSEVDPRYYWVVSDGVLLMRPLEAWGDEEHFLNQPIGEFSLEEGTAAEALDLLWRRLSEWPSEMAPAGPRSFHRTRTDQVGWLLTIELTATSGVLALDAIVRAHGALSWSLTYCKPEARPEYARIGFQAHDGRGGFGQALWPSVPSPSEPGKLVFPCRS
jgi:hypothetical protein